MPTDPAKSVSSEPFNLAAAAVSQFRRDGYVRLKSVLPASAIERYRGVFSDLVESRRAAAKPMAERSTYEKAFLQVCNLWRRSDEARDFVFSATLAEIAAKLMEVKGVRLYHDQALFKEAGGGPTPWHADQYYWPVSSDRTVTAWLPLQTTPVAMGPLAFAPGSHRMEAGRDLAIGAESEAAMAEALARVAVDEAEFEIGDVSFHAGWTFHRAGPNETDAMRAAMTVIYIDEEMRLAAPANDAQAFDARVWCRDVAVGDLIAGPLNPVIWSAT